MKLNKEQKQMILTGITGVIMFDPQIPRNYRASLTKTCFEEQIEHLVKIPIQISDLKVFVAEQTKKRVEDFKRFLDNSKLKEKNHSKDLGKSRKDELVALTPQQQRQHEIKDGRIERFVIRNPKKSRKRDSR